MQEGIEGFDTNDCYYLSMQTETCNHVSLRGSYSFMNFLKRKM